MQASSQIRVFMENLLEECIPAEADALRQVHEDVLQRQQDVTYAD